MSHISEKDKKFLRNAALVGAAVFVIVNPKSAAKIGAGSALLLGSAIYGIRWLQSEQD
jgi:hypothetical protein